MCFQHPLSLPVKGPTTLYHIILQLSLYMSALKGLIALRGDRGQIQLSLAIPASSTALAHGDDPYMFGKGVDAS